MRAMVWTRYGPPEALQLREVEEPVPGADQVLVEVRAASLNSWDLDLLEGRASINLGGRLKPKYRVLGCDVAGLVERCGRAVRGLRPGDAVFGDLSRGEWGAFAERVCAQETMLARIPAGMSFEQAAALPQAGGLALQGLGLARNGLQGRRVLINGAGGGVGTLAVQVARSMEAEVTGVDAAEKLPLLRSLGAQHVMDYAKEDFAASGDAYDLIVDVVARRSVLAYRRCLRPRGTCVVVGGTGRAAMQALLLGPWILGRGRRSRLLLYRPSQEDLGRLGSLWTEGKARPVLDKVYPLEELPLAFHRLRSGKAQGKVVISVR